MREAKVILSLIFCFIASVSYPTRMSERKAEVLTRNGNISNMELHVFLKIDFIKPENINDIN